MSKIPPLPKFPVVKGEFGPRLYKLRRERQLSIKEIADILGIDRKTYRSWEDPNSDALPRKLNTFLLLCEVLKVTPLYLATGLFGEEKEERHSKVYIDIYDRYRNDLDFHFIVSTLMKTDDSVIRSIAELIEAVDVSYKGTHPLLEN